MDMSLKVLVLVLVLVCFFFLFFLINKEELEIRNLEYQGYKQTDY